jgi:hypothetical protein
MALVGRSKFIHASKAAERRKMILKRESFLRIPDLCAVKIRVFRTDIFYASKKTQSVKTLFYQMKLVMVISKLHLGRL